MRFISPDGEFDLMEYSVNVIEKNMFELTAKLEE